MALNSSYRENGSIVITSGDRLTIETAAAFARLVREALETVPHVELEFEAAVAMDITGLQIICSACRTASSGGRSFTFRGGKPQGLIDIITLCGAERHALCRHANDSDCIWFGGQP